jgi:hypothetical protein
MASVAAFFSMPGYTPWAILAGSFIVSAKLCYLVLAFKGKIHQVSNTLPSSSRKPR